MVGLDRQESCDLGCRHMRVLSEPRIPKSVNRYLSFSCHASRDLLLSKVEIHPETFVVSH